MVVSESGEQWSPITEPVNTADMPKGKGTPKAKAKGTAIGIAIAIVPQEVPVAKEIRLQIINITIGSKTGEITPLTAFTT